MDNKELNKHLTNLNKNYKETLAKQEDLNWDGNTETQDSTTEYTIVVDEDRMEQLRKLINDKS